MAESTKKYMTAALTTVRMDRLSKVIERELGIEVSHEELTRLGYRAEKKQNNPNTYYTVPGAAKVVENIPRVMAYIRDHLSAKNALFTLGATKQANNRRTSGPAALSNKRPPSADPAAADAGGDGDGAVQDTADAEAAPLDNQTADDENGSRGAAVIDVPSGYTLSTAERATKVFEGLAHGIRHMAQSRHITGDTLRARGMIVLEELRVTTPAPGERMRHPWLWWPGKLTSPIRCAQYMHCIKALLEVEACKEAFGVQPKTHKAAAGAAAPGSSTAALQRKRSSDALTLSAGPARNAAAAAVAAAVKRTRTAATPAAAAPATVTAAQGPDKVTRNPSPAAAQHTASRRVRRASRGSTAAAITPAAQHEAKLPPSSLAEGAAAAAAAEGSGVQPPAAAAKSPVSDGRVRGRQSHFAGHSSAAGAAVDRQVTAAAAENSKVLAYVDDVIQQLGDALSVAGSFSPSVLAFMPAVFTAGVAAPMQDFLSHGNPRHVALAEDRKTCDIILAEYTPDQPFRKTYLAFRGALQAEASAAAAWLHGGQQQEMLEKLRVLTEFKQRLEEQRRNEEQARVREEALRKKELELQAAMEQLERERELMARVKEQQQSTTQENQQKQQPAEEPQPQQQKAEESMVPAA